MTELQALILGAVQGVSEFLPISSSGHLILLPKIFGWTAQSMSFDIAVHFGTLTAICLVMRKELLEIVTRMRYNLDFALKVLLATIPAVVFGLLAGDAFFTIVRNPVVVAINLIVFGVLLFIADLLRVETTRKPTALPSVTWVQAVLVGLAQMVAIIPGVSRSGVTMTAGLFLRMDRVSVARFTFLLAIPVIFGAGMMNLLDFTGDETVRVVAVGMLSSAVFGWISATALLAVISRISLGWFTLYRMIVGIAILLLVV
jgi:undecaprenyl-diphosphatase